MGPEREVLMFRIKTWKALFLGAGNLSEEVSPRLGTRQPVN